MATESGESGSTDHGHVCNINANGNPLKWKKLKSWIQCICIVTFDLELGQAIEVIFPNDALSEEDQTNICYLAFPDSNSGCMGDTQFHFRIRQTSGAELSEEHVAYNNKCPPYLQVHRAYFYGYVFFRQVKDHSLPRGYFQKSVIIISRLPFINLFTELCGIIAPEFFNHGLESITAACHDIDRWPSLSPGHSVVLPIFGSLIQTQIPVDSNKSQPSIGISSVASCLSSTLLATVHEINIFNSFSHIVSHIHLLWELVLIGEPIIVMSSSPAVCSQMVQALVSMIVPLKYHADFRPYFTIHDNEFKEYTSRAQAPPSVILGVTNPFFAKTLQHWPHVIKIPDSANLDNSQTFKLKKRGSGLKLLDSKPGVYTQYQPHLQKDKAIVKKLLKGITTNRPNEVQSALLKRHLLELTQSFMIPLERYMGTLMPLQKNVSPFKATPVPYPFNPDDFFASLESSGPQLTSRIKGDWEGLYRKFFRSLNFSGWYNAKYKKMAEKLEVLQLKALSDADFKKWVLDKQEVERVDMILRIRHKIELCESQAVTLNDFTRDQLKVKINDIIASLPDDLKIVLSPR
ncbi:unnamed protein product [Bemisia tabaci]|uniref:UDENN domain-containing protein n=1 Tax=Bemisia tabaci TaxID=7038 RepID=A0A9P0F7J2_BEMTA|nr:unnamed protein product [Bemisia tabaci]